MNSNENVESQDVNALRANCTAGWLSVLARKAKRYYVSFRGDILLRCKVSRYQELRRGRGRLVQVHKKMLQVMDQMEAMRRQEVPRSGQDSSQGEA